ncbi:hypothetical protein D9M73_262900 [compost metagenome]
MLQARRADVDPRLEEVGRAGLAQVDFDLDSQAGWQHHIHILGHQPDGGGIASRPGAGEQLLGGRVRLGGGEHVDRLGAARGRQVDVEAAVMATSSIACAAGGGVGFAGSQDFFDLAHG